MKQINIQYKGLTESTEKFVERINNLLKTLHDAQVRPIVEYEEASGEGNSYLGVFIVHEVQQ